MENWNYKRGKDANGADLPMHVFINPDRSINGTGTSTDPFNSWTSALALVVHTGTIVVAPSLSLNEINNYTVTKRVYIIGDSLNRDVHIKSTFILPARRINSHPSQFFFENIFLDGYEESTYANNQRKNCVVQSPATRMSYEISGNSIQDATTIYLNSNVNCDSHNGLNGNHTLYASNLFITDNNLTFKQLYIGEGCTVAPNDDVTSVTFDRCYFENKTDFLASAPVGFTVIITNEVTSPTLLNAPTLIDYSVLNKDSSLLNVGAVSVGGQAFKGISYNTTQTNIQTLINANPYLEIFNGNIRFKAVVEIGSVTEIGGNGEIEFVATTLLELSKPMSIGLGFNPEIQFFIRWKFSINDAFSDWKEFRLGEVPTQNIDGKTNGEFTFDWNDNNKIPYALAQGKIVLTKK